MNKHILYLASGSSRRFGSNKLLYMLEGKPLFLYGLETLLQAAEGREDCTITVVSRYEAIRTAAQTLGLRAVDSPESEKGISYTIRAGIAGLERVEPEDCLLFVVADQPYLTAASVENLLELANEGAQCGSLAFGGCPGNPTLFSASLIPELMALEGDRGGRAVLKKHGCVFVQAASEKELQDIDIPQI